MCGLGLCSCCLWALPAPLPLLGSGLLLIARVRGDPPFNLETHTDNRLTLLLLICGCHTENQISRFWIHCSHTNSGNCESCESETHQLNFSFRSGVYNGSNCWFSHYGSEHPLEDQYDIITLHIMTLYIKSYLHQRHLDPWKQLAL